MSSDFPLPAPALLEALKSLLGKSGWRGPEQFARYMDDPRGRFTGHATLVVMPSDTAQVASIVKLCSHYGAGIVTYGGGTGVVAGQISPDDPNAIVLSLERMNKIRAFHAADNALIVEAGCILENIHAEALKHDLQFPLAMASQGSCTIGGNLATNAGGIRVVRYGNARDLCLGIEAVLPNGDILQELTPLRKNNTGYDLRHLLIGSEGTLGIITAASLALSPVEAETETALAAVASPAQALALFSQLRKSIGPNLSALELMSGFGMDLVTRHFPDLKPPFSQTHPWYLLVEADGGVGFSADFHAAMEQGFELGLALDAVIAQSQGQRHDLWALRENTPEANKAEGAVCNSDTSVPIGQIEGFIADTHKALAAVDPGLRVNSYGHIGDGNIHHNVFPAEGTTKAEYIKQKAGNIEKIRMAINKVTAAHGGSISAEHGIGRLKTGDLATFASPEKMRALRAVKTALDPKNIMNPGALLSRD